MNTHELRTRREVLGEILEIEKRFLDRMKPGPQGNCTADEIDRQEIAVLRVEIELIDEGRP